MLKLSIEELSETAESLIAPVRLGVTRPTAPFTLSTNSNPDIQVCIMLLSQCNIFRKNK